jgi:hypothetical protein
MLPKKDDDSDKTEQMRSAMLMYEMFWNYYLRVLGGPNKQH